MLNSQKIVYIFMVVCVYFECKLVQSLNFFTNFFKGRKPKVLTLTLSIFTQSYKEETEISRKDILAFWDKNYIFKMGFGKYVTLTNSAKNGVQSHWANFF